jgi:hypothetical protein
MNSLFLRYNDINNTKLKKIPARLSLAGIVKLSDKLLEITSKLLFSFDRFE